MQENNTSVRKGDQDSLVGGRCKSERRMSQSSLGVELPGQTIIRTRTLACSFSASYGNWSGTIKTVVHLLPSPQKQKQSSVSIVLQGLRQVMTQTHMSTSLRDGDRTGSNKDDIHLNARSTASTPATALSSIDGNGKDVGDYIDHCPRRSLLHPFNANSPSYLSVEGISPLWCTTRIPYESLLHPL